MCAPNAGSSKPPGRSLKARLTSSRTAIVELLVTLADCEKARSVSVHDRCKAAYDGLSVST
jgi:hypothetical protein